MTHKEIANEARRKARRKQTGEVFTPHSLVNKIVDHLPEEVWNTGKTFCDPCCGNGNILIAVLWRKLQHGHNPLEALRCVYGVDIIRDNIRECRLRLLKVSGMFDEITGDHIKAVFQNIVCLDTNKYPKGSLDYDFAFEDDCDVRDVNEWLALISKGMLEEVSLPYTEEECGKRIETL